jgi:hypothetical protein
VVVATTKAIRQALVDTLKPAPDLTDIKTWHRVSGFVPDRHNPTGAVADLLSAPLFFFKTKIYVVFYI